MKTILYLLLIFFLGSTTCYAETTSPKPAGTKGAESKKKEWAVLPHLPKQTLAIFSLKDVTKSYARFQKTGLWNLLNHPLAQTALQKPLGMAKGRLKVIKQTIGHDLLKILGTMKGETTIALLGFLEERNEKGEPIPDLLIAFQPRGQTEVWMDEWDRFIEKLNEKTENTIEFTESLFAGANVVNLSHPASPIEITYCMHEGVFLASLGPGRVENILAARAAATKNKLTGDTLQSHPRYKRALEKLGGNYDVFLQVNTKGLRNTPQIKFKPKNPKEERDWKAIGLNGIDSVTYGLSIQNRGIRETIYFNTPRNKRSGIMGILDGVKGDTSIANAPKDALAALAFKFSPELLLTRLIELASADNPGFEQEMNKVFDKLGQQLQLDFKKEIIGTLTGEVAFNLSVTPVHPKVRIGFPSPILTLGVQSNASAQTALNALKTAGNKSHQFTETTHQGITITYARENKSQDKDPGMFCYALMDKKVILSLYPLAIQEEIDRLKSKTVDTLQNASDYQSASENIRSTANAMLYLDTGALAATAYSILIPIAQMKQAKPKFLDINALPSAAVLAKNLEGTLFTINEDAQGLALEAYSSTGIWATALPAIAILDKIKKKRRGRRTDNPQVARKRKGKTKVNSKTVNPPEAPPDF